MFDFRSGLVVYFCIFLLALFQLCYGSSLYDFWCICNGLVMVWAYLYIHGIKTGFIILLCYLPLFYDISLVFLAGPRSVVVGLVSVLAAPSKLRDGPFKWQSLASSCNFLLSTIASRY
jgi:hypothetical protein